MCLTCRILNPLSDTAADLLGVEKRKYLVYGYTLYKLMKDNKKSKYGGYDCTIHNNNTIRCLNGNLDDYKKVTINGVDLYEGKLKVVKKLPIPKPTKDYYAELFEGDIIWSDAVNEPIESIESSIKTTENTEEIKPCSCSCSCNK
jgi:hypothetical protein